MDLTGICIVGFIVLGIYKFSELLVRRKERLMFLEKFFTHCENKEVSGSFQMPPNLFGNRNYGSWSLRIALLLIGIGIGCLLAFFTWLVTWLEVKNVASGGWHGIQDFISFSYIAIFGGIGLLISYFIESRQSKKK
jgi:hypothetical protein